MSRYDQYSDEELIFRLRQGEMEISDYLMEKYKEFVRKKARAMFLIGGETDDLIQEGMIGLLAALRAYQPKRGAAFRTFAGTCIENAIQTALRKFSRRKDVPTDNMVPLEDYLDHAGTAVSAEDDFLAAESVARLSRALEQQLSPMENEVLRLHISGFRYADIASRLNKSPKAVDNALQRIRKKLTLLFE